jgi:hypothetical protein
MIPRELIGPLRTALPDADLDAASYIGEGWAQVALRVPAGDGDWVLRHPLLRKYDNAAHPELRAMAVADLEREAKLLPELLAYGLPVPREMLLLRDKDGRTIGSVHRLLEGDPITRAMLIGGRRRRLAAAFGEFFTRLHSFPSDRAVALGLKSIDLWSDHYQPLVEGCQPLLAARSREWLDATVGRFLDEGGMTGAPRVLIHADIGPEHLRVDAGGAFAGSIDFGDAMVAVLHNGYMNREWPTYIDETPADPGALRPLFQPYFPDYKRAMEAKELPYLEGTLMFRVSLGNAWRRIAAPDDATLDDLARTILDAFEFEMDHLYCFELRQTNGRKLVIACPDENDAVAFTDDFALGQLPIAEGGTMTMIFDYGTSWHFSVKFEEISCSAKTHCPRVVAKGGKPPAQYDWEDEEDWE